MGLPQDNVEDTVVGSPINFAEGLKGNCSWCTEIRRPTTCTTRGTERLVNDSWSSASRFDSDGLTPTARMQSTKGAGTTAHIHHLIARYFLDHLRPASAGHIWPQPVSWCRPPFRRPASRPAEARHYVLARRAPRDLLPYAFLKPKLRIGHILARTGKRGRSARRRGRETVADVSSRGRSRWSSTTSFRQRRCAMAGRPRVDGCSPVTRYATLTSPSPLWRASPS